MRKAKRLTHTTTCCVDKGKHFPPAKDGCAECGCSLQAKRHSDLSSPHYHEFVKKAPNA